MADFILFEELIEKYDKTQIPEECKNESNKIISKEQICTHKDIITEKGISLCINCGEELQTYLEFDKEWRYYGNNDTKYGCDPNRVQMRKNDERTIFKDIESLGLSESIANLANKLYSELTTDNKIYRGKSRKSRVFACVFHAYKLSKNPQSLDKLLPIFNLDRPTALKGLKAVNMDAPKDSEIRQTYITPLYFVKEILEKFHGTDAQLEEIKEIYEKIKNKSPKLETSRPQSVASSIVYFWICKTKKNITLKDFAKRVKLSELTIKKIIAVINEIIEKSNLNESN